VRYCFVCQQSREDTGYSTLTPGLKSSGFPIYKHFQLLMAKPIKFEKSSLRKNASDEQSVFKFRMFFCSRSQVCLCNLLVAEVSHAGCIVIKPTHWISLCRRLSPFPFGTAPHLHLLTEAAIH
jgi:hypothetical protein